MAETQTNLPQQPVAGRMTQRIIDQGEAIKVEHGDRALAIFGELIEGFEKARSVRQPGQGVFVSELENLLLAAGDLFAHAVEARGQAANFVGR